jgi:hypothetical protein
MFELLTKSIKSLDDIGLSEFLLLFTSLIKIFSSLLVILSITIIITRALIMKFAYFWVLSFVLWTIPISSKGKTISFEMFKQAIAYSLHIPILSLILVVFGEVVDTMLNTNGNSSSLKDSLFVLVVSYAIFKIFDQIAEVANAIVGSQSNSSGADLTPMALAGAMGAKGLAEVGKAKGGALASSLGSKAGAKIGKVGKEAIGKVKEYFKK